jgi:biopolymer transport protein TolR
MSLSQRARRMAQHQLRRGTEVELNLIPLIDIMSVLVAFLLVYSADVEVVQNSKGVEVPYSLADERPSQSVVVMVTKEQLFVQGELVTSVAAIRNANTPLIDPLRAVLTRPMLGSDDAAGELAGREVTVIADKSLSYDVVKRVMSTCTYEGYGRVSLAVLEKDSSPTQI